MSVQPIDAETTEIVAGVVRPLRRAADLAWVATDSDSAASSNQPLALGIDLAADKARNLLPSAVPIDSRRHVLTVAASAASVRHSSLRADDQC
jgi:hypothetical protein